MFTGSFGVRIRNHDRRFATDTAGSLVQELGILSALRVPSVELEEVAEELLNAGNVNHRHDEEHELGEAVPDELSVHEVEGYVARPRTSVY